MPVIKTLPLTVANSISVGIGATSAYYGVDVADYISAGLSLDVIINPIASGTLYLKLYGCNDNNYSTNQKFDIFTVPLTAANPRTHISLRCLEFRNMVLRVVNSTTYSLTFSASLVGVRLS